MWCGDSWVTSWPVLLILYLYRAQPKRISNNADRGKRHGRRRNHWRQQNAKCGIEHARRNGNPGGIVNEGEEQVLPDIVQSGGMTEIQTNGRQDAMSPLSQAAGDLSFLMFGPPAKNMFGQCSYQVIDFARENTFGETDLLQSRSTNEIS
jgi:hypothetical protein